MLSMLMCIQNLVRFCKFVFKILSGNQIFTDSRNHGKTESRKDGITEGQGESSIAPLFQNGAIIMQYYFVIRKTCPCNIYPLEPHFYIANLGYCRGILFFLFLLQNIDCGYSLEPPRRGGSNVYPQSMF